jgi:hypothetical protein
LSGRLVLPDGKPPPAGADVSVALRSDDVSVVNGQTGVADAAGRFTFTSLPSGLYSFHVRLPNYYLSPQNRSLDVLSRMSHQLTGRIDEDMEGLRILLQPDSPPVSPDPNSLSQDAQEAIWRAYQRNRSSPLRGIE